MLTTAQNKAATVQRTPAAATHGAGLGSSHAHVQGSTFSTSIQYPNSRAQVIETKMRAAADLLAALAAHSIAGCGIFLVWGIRPDGRCGCGNPTCENPGKHPIGKLHPHGFKDATSDLGKLRSWLQQYPYANLALAFGPNLGAVDVDPRHGGSIDALPLTWAQKQTLAQNTGGGGDHFLYRIPDPGPGTHWLNDEIGTGIDFKTAGGYIILAPSNHYTGGRYAWKPDQGPGEVAILDAPPALVSILPCERHSNEGDRPAAPASADLSARFTWLLGELVPDLDDTKRQGLVCCPFHDDHNPSLSYNLDRAVFHCHAPGCPAHDSKGARGGLRGLAALAKREHGLVIPWEAKQRKVEPATEAAVSSAPATSESFQTPAPSPRVIPWAITPGDWRECPYCAATWHGAKVGGGEFHARLYHRFCHRKGCPVWTKVHAGDLLAGIEDWTSIYTATVAPSAWNSTRLRLRRAGARSLGIPTETGEIITITDREILPGSTSTDDLFSIYTAVCAAPGRVRRAHKSTREELAAEIDEAIACEEGERAAVTSFKGTTKGERLDVLNVELAHQEPPAELVAIARSVCGQFPPEARDMIRAAWFRCGLVVEGNQARGSIEQARQLLGEINAIRQQVRELMHIQNNQSSCSKSRSVQDQRAAIGDEQALAQPPKPAPGGVRSAGE